MRFSKQGLTLIELLTVVGLAGLLAVFLLGGLYALLHTWQASAEQVMLEAEGRTFHRLIEADLESAYAINGEVFNFVYKDDPFYASWPCSSAAGAVYTVIYRLGPVPDLPGIASNPTAFFLYRTVVENQALILKDFCPDEAIIGPICSLQLRPAFEANVLLETARTLEAELVLLDSAGRPTPFIYRFSFLNQLASQL